MPHCSQTIPFMLKKCPIMPSKCPVMLKFPLKIMRLSCVSTLTPTFGELSNGQKAFEPLIRYLCLCFQSLNHSLAYCHSRTGSDHYYLVLTPPRHSARYAVNPGNRTHIHVIIPVSRPFMLALCSMLSTTDYARFYARLIGAALLRARGLSTANFL